MCGFSAYYYFDPVIDRSLSSSLDASLDQIRHRGPDSDGKYISDYGRCGLGHVRLSINDLDGGHQPLSSPTESVYAVVNGEFYDFERIREDFISKGYTFKTRSDSEILLPLYQEYNLSCLEHLRGEFAFCLFDVKRDRFVAARDRFGIKPLYYTVQNGVLLAASEIKAFIPMGWKPEWDVDSIVNNGSLLDYRTCFKGVYKLPPAHYLVAHSSGYMEIRPYWAPEYPDKNVQETRSVDEMIKGVHDRLEEAVRLRLRADVPVGVYLSGGIDSSSIAGIASKMLKERNPDARIKAFSIGFKDGGRLDESEIAERTARFIDADFEKLEITEQDLLENLEECIWHAEMPLPNLNCVGKFLLSKTVRDKGYKTIMSGEGSDEHFGGYFFLKRDFLLEPDRATPNGFGTVSDEKREEIFQENKMCTGVISPEKDDDRKNVADEIIRASSAAKMTNNAISYALLALYGSAKRVFFTDQVVHTYGLPDYATAIAETTDGMIREKFMKKWHPLHTSLYIHGRTIFSNVLCGPMGDRSEMAHSVEGRTPFLDHPFCEYINGLPPSVKIKIEDDGSLNEKWTLKQATRPYITDEIYNRTKQPYLAPPSKGKDKTAVEILNRLITEENISRLGWANFELVNSTKQEFFETGEAILFSDLLIVMSFVILSHQFNVQTYLPTSLKVAKEYAVSADSPYR